MRRSCQRGEGRLSFILTAAVFLILVFLAVQAVNLIAQRFVLLFHLFHSFHHLLERFSSFPLEFLGPLEFQTPRAIEELQFVGFQVQFTHRFAEHRLDKRADIVERRRQMRDVELEKKQKLWRWLIVAALGILVLETWLAGRKRPLTSNDMPEQP